jgi:hypothetical protein
MARDERSWRPTEDEEEPRGRRDRTRSIPNADLHGDPTTYYPDDEDVAEDAAETDEGAGADGGAD